MAIQNLGYYEAVVGLSESSVLLNKPTTSEAGDLFVVALHAGGVRAVTPPTGWSLLRQVTNTYASTYVYTKTAETSEPSSYTFSIDAADQLVAGIYQLRGAARVSFHTFGESSSSGGGHSYTLGGQNSVVGDYELVLAAAGGASSSGTPQISGDTFDSTEGLANGTSNLRGQHWRKAITANGTRPTLTISQSPNFSGAGTGIRVVASGNVPPNAPTLDVPSSVDRNVTNRVNLTPSDPDPGDTTSKTDWRYREIGASTWTTVSKTSPTTFCDFAAGTFLGADYEMQARTYDALGEVGPWSSSSFFTANDAPDQPTWIDPLNGQTIGTASYTGTISAPDVDESEWRLVADNAGVIDEATVLHGPVLKTTGDLRSHTFSGLTNGVTVWWQARTKFGGLWSQWAAVRTPVAYTPPPAPTLTPAASNEDGAVSVTVSTPAPGAGEPTVEYVDLYVRDTTGADTYRPATGIRWAMFRVPNGVTVDWKAASGINYEYQAVAHGDNGTTAASVWTAIDPDAVATIYYGGY